MALQRIRERVGSSTLVLILGFVSVPALAQAPQAAAPTAPATAATPAPLTGTLKKIVDSGVITIAHRESYTPFSFVDTNKRPVGYSLDICHKIVGAIKTDLKLPNLQVKYVQVDPQTRIQTIRDGKADIECSGTTHTLSRRKDVDFSLSIMLSGTRLVSKTGSAFNDLRALAGKKVAAAANTTMLKGAQAAAKEAKVTNITWIETKDHDAAFVAVKKGEADAAAIEDLVIIGLLAKEKNPNDYKTSDEYLSFEPNALMLRQDDSAFRAVVDRAIARTFASGEITQIYDRWFKPLKVPMSDRFRSAIAIQSIPE